MANEKVNSVRIKRLNEQSNFQDDLVVVEEPMEIRLLHGQAGDRREFSLSVTMRTPDNDFELTIGFLFTEGIVQSYDDIKSIRYCESVKEEEEMNVVKVILQEAVEIDERKLQRHFYTSSSCGVCGKSSIESIEVVGNFGCAIGKIALTADQILALPERVQKETNSL